MFLKKQNFFFTLAMVFVFFLSASAASADFNPPGAAPPSGNVALPVYSQGSGQTLSGSLTVTAGSGTALTGSAAVGLQGTGTTAGVEGGGTANAIFGNLAADSAGGDRALYGLVVDAADYAGYLSGGLGLGFASGDIWFLQQDAGIAWPRESDGEALYGVYVNSAGQLQIRGHGGGIAFTDQSVNTLLTISEVGAVNVAAGGSLTVDGVDVCLEDGTNCAAGAVPTLQTVTTAGATTDKAITISNQLWLTGGWSQNGAPYHAALQIYGTYPSLSFRSSTSNSTWLYHMAADNSLHWYNDPSSKDTANWTSKMSLSAAGSLNVSGNAYVSGTLTLQGSVFDATNAAALYLNAYGDAQIRIDTNNDGANQFKINNGENATVLTVDESGNLAASGNITAAGQSVCRADGTNCPAGATPTLQTVTTAGATTTLGITAGGLTSTANLTLQGSVFDATNATALYLNAYGDAQIRIDTNNDGANQFKINNGENATVLTVDESGNLAASGNITAAGQSVCRADGTNCPGIDTSVGGGWTDDGTTVRLTTSTDSVGIGTADPGSYKLNVNGNAYVSDNLTVGGLFTSGADFAEEFATDERFEPGTVMAMGDRGYKSAIPAAKEYDTSVIGVVSSDAGIIMGRVEGPDKSVIALVGVVRVKVVGYNGDIKKGDLLTSSAVEGYAMRADNPRVGTVIGKALEPFSGGQGAIMALVNLQ